MSFMRILKQERWHRGWSQAKLAQELDTSPNRISVWERGLEVPSPHFRERLCTLFHKSAEDLGLLPQSESISSSPVTASSPSTTSSLALYDPALPLQTMALSHLIGRNALLEHLKHLLQTGKDQMLLALHGLPGVGKTTLALGLLYDPEMQTRFPDGVLWVGLGPRPHVTKELSRWGATLGIPSSELKGIESRRDWGRVLRARIGLQRLLLVIDDAWASEDALAFLVGGPNCAYLVTTRSSQLAATLTSQERQSILVPELNESDSLALLTEMFSPWMLQEQLSLHELVRAVGGLPLALTLMGKYLRTQAYSKQPRRLHAALAHLQDAASRLRLSSFTPPVDSPPALSDTEATSLQAIIAVSDEHLPPHVQEALRTLSIFPAKPNSFSEDAALVVMEQSAEVLDHLVDAGLLESCGQNRYSLHQTIADYAQTHLEKIEAYQRFVSYFVGYVQDYKEDYEALERESTNIIAALQIAFEQAMHREFMQGVVVLMSFLQIRGLYPLAEVQLQRAYQIASEVNDVKKRVVLLLQQGVIARKRGNYIQSEEYAYKALALGRFCEDPDIISHVLTLLGKVMVSRGEYAKAERYFEEGLTLAHRLGHQDRISELLTNLGTLKSRHGEYAKAERYFEEGLMLARRLGDQELISLLLTNLGVAAAIQGDPTTSEAYFEEGLMVARQLGHQERISLLLSNLGFSKVLRGEYAKAEAYFEEGLTLARRSGHQEGMSMLLTNLGEMGVVQGNYARAEAYFEEGLTLARHLENQEHIATNLCQLGGMHLVLEHVTQAEKLFHEASENAPAGHQVLAATIQYGLARVQATQGHTATAYQQGIVSLRMLEALNHYSIAEVREWLATLAYETNLPKG